MEVEQTAHLSLRCGAEELVRALRSREVVGEVSVGANVSVPAGLAVRWQNFRRLCSGSVHPVHLTSPRITNTRPLLDARCDITWMNRWLSRLFMICGG